MDTSEDDFAVTTNASDPENARGTISGDPLPRLAPREAGPTAGRLSPMQDLSDPTTDADDDIVDAFFGLGLSAVEIKEHWQQVQLLLRSPPSQSTSARVLTACLWALTTTTC